MREEIGTCLCSYGRNQSASEDYLFIFFRYLPGKY